MTYDERVQALAEEMAMEYYDGDYPVWQETRKELAQKYIAAAHIAVNHMADAIRKALRGGTAMVLYTSIERYLKEEGLIPDVDPSGVSAMGPGH